MFGDDRKLLANWLHKTYGNKLTREEEKLALRFQCSGWGRLSRAFLTEIYHGESSTGEAMSIMDMLWETNYNLMELLSSRFDFAGAVQAYRAAHLNQYMSLQDYLDESYASDLLYSGGNSPPLHKHCINFNIATLQRQHTNE